MKFTDMNLSQATLDALAHKGFESPSPIQEACIPVLVEGTHDVIGQAQTGTGKTAAFSIPMIEKIDLTAKHTQAIVLAPTRELAIQVADEIASLKGKRRLNVAVVYGGASIGPQIRKLKAGAQIVVGTPGRVMDHLNRGTLQINNLDFFVLDEADEMLNMGFEEDISQILSVTNPDKQMLFFSATMPREILQIAKSYMRPGYEVIKVKAQQLTTANTEQIYIEVYQKDKNEALSRIIDAEVDMYGIVFCKTKRGCDELAQRLNNRGYQADSLHGDMDQREREKVMDAFKNKQSTLLVATDVAARGIDVDDLTHVINYEIPQNAESYTHRIGRTGRAGKQGVAITLVTPAEYRQLLYIQKVTKSEIEKKSVPEVTQIIEIRKNHILDTVKDASQNPDTQHFKEITEQLLEHVSHEQLVYGLLNLAFADQLDESNYRTIKTVDRSNLGNTRLFVARGRNEGLGPKELVNRIKQEANIQDKDINDVRVFDEFSFITCPYAEAEMLIHVFKKKAKGRRPLINKARDKNDSGPRSRRGGGQRRGRHGGGHRRGRR